MSGCQRCLEAIPARYDAARTHLTKDCVFPPNSNSNKPKANFRVVLVPDANFTDAPQESYYDEHNQIFDANYYEQAVVEDVTNDELVSNKDYEYYQCIPDSLSSHQTPVKFQALPIRKVQTLTVDIHGVKRNPHN